MFINAPFSSYLRRKDGSTAVIAALTIVPIVLMFGFAMDIQRANAVKLHVQAAADSAALAGARQYYKGGDHAKDVAQAFFDESLKTIAHAPNCASPNITTNSAQASVTIAASCTIDTTVSGIIGTDKITLTAHSSARSQQSKLDLALMLDVSGSMKGSKIKDLKEAANTAVDILLAGSGDDTRIALAPYSTAVNAGTYAEAAVGPVFNAKRKNATCVTERSGPAKKSGEAPGIKSYVGYSAATCPDAAVLPLTNNSETLHDQIKSLKANGHTAGQLGIAWSWYAISPEWSSFWPAASKPRKYNEVDTVKAVILMTDGEFNRTYDPKQGNSVNQSKAMCKEMRDAGVVIYSVAFKAPPGGKAVLQNCASSADHYFEASSGDALIDAYGEIATSLSNLRLTN